MKQIDSQTWPLNLRSWLGLLALALTFWLIINHAGLLLEVSWVFFGAVLLSLAIRPLADRLAHWRIPHGMTMLLVYLLFGALLVLMAYLLAPLVRSEVSQLRNSGPDLVRTALSRLKTMPVVGSLLPSADTLASDLTQRLDLLVSTALGTVASIGGLLLDVLLVLVLAYFFVIDSSVGESLLTSWVPQRRRDQVRAVANRVRQRLARWVWAQVAIAAYFALIFSVGLSLLGVPFAFSIGLVGGVLEIIPYLGGAVALSLAALSALSVKPILALWVLIFYLVVVEIESHVIAPTFYGRIIGLHPVVVLLALVVGAKAQGIVGVLFAVPVAVVLGTVIQEAKKTVISPREDSTPDHEVNPEM